METLLMQKVLPYAKKHCKPLKNQEITATVIAVLLKAMEDVYKDGFKALDLEKKSEVNRMVSEIPLLEVREFYQYFVKAFQDGTDREHLLCLIRKIADFSRFIFP